MSVKMLGSEVSVDRSTLADMLASPLAKLLSEDGSVPISAADIKAKLLDPNTNIEFPTFNITGVQRAGVVVVEKVVVEKVVVHTAAGKKIDRLIREDQ